MKKVIIIGILFLITGVFIFYRQDNFVTKSVQYNGNNLRISIDGNTSSILPASGNYYLADYTCKNADTVVTWNRTTYQLNVSNGSKGGGVSCYLDFQSNPKLSDMPVGSYVTYTGNNGCSEESCSGQNANYESGDKLGYCNDVNYQFITSGWRIGYVKDGSAYLISAGATDCMCTNSSNVTSSSSCTSYLAAGISSHITNMDEVALKYCNKIYSYQGICDENTSWGMDATDFKNIVGKNLSSSSCYTKPSEKVCGYANDLIDIGSYYWYATAYGSSLTTAFYWNQGSRDIIDDFSSGIYGVRPVLRLDSTVIVVGGSGTSTDPYQITNNTFLINGGVDSINASEKSSVELTLYGQDVATMCINVDSSGCSNYVDFVDTYTLDWSDEEAGEKIIYVYYKNSAGEIIASISRSVTISD